MGRLECDQIKWLITLTSDYSKRFFTVLAKLINCHRNNNKVGRLVGGCKDIEKMLISFNTECDVKVE